METHLASDTTARPGAIGRLVAATLLAIPVGGLGWLELRYLAFGVTGTDGTSVGNAVSALAAFGLTLLWSLAGATRAAAVVRRGCRLGLLLAMLLPVVAVVVLLLWERSTGRPDLGMGGLMLYNMPIVAFVMSLVLIIIFWAGQAAANRRLTSPPSE